MPDRLAGPAQRRAVRRQVLAGTLRIIRARRAWNVDDAANAAGIAPMTWRRLEDALNVRRRTLIALDELLDQPTGTVERALDDDLTMVALSGLANGDSPSVAAEDAADYLDGLAERFRSGAAHLQPLPTSGEMRDAQIVALSLVAHVWRAGAQGDIAGGLAGINEIFTSVDPRLVAGALAGFAVGLLEAQGIDDIPGTLAYAQLQAMTDDGGQA